MSVEHELKQFILRKFGTITNFSKITGVPNSTLSSIFQRGVLNANVLNMIAICNALAIDIDSLANGKIEPKQVNVNISLKEQQLLIAYNQHKEFQLAIDTLLGIAEKQPQKLVQTKVLEPELKVARSSNLTETQPRKLTKEQWDELENGEDINLN